MRMLIWWLQERRLARLINHVSWTSQMRQTMSQHGFTDEHTEDRLEFRHQQLRSQLERLLAQMYP